MKNFIKTIGLLLISLLALSSCEDKESDVNNRRFAKLSIYELEHEKKKLRNNVNQGKYSMNHTIDIWKGRGCTITTKEVADHMRRCNSFFIKGLKNTKLSPTDIYSMYSKEQVGTWIVSATRLYKLVYPNGTPKSIMIYQYVKGTTNVGRESYREFL